MHGIIARRGLRGREPRRPRRETGPVDMDRSSLPPVLCIFEDERYPNFFPLSLNRPAFDLSIGTQSLRARLVDELNPAILMLLCRPYLAAVLSEEEARDASRATRVNELPEGEVLFLNGRLLAYGKELGELCESLKKDSVLQKKGILVAARLSGDRAASFVRYIGATITDERVEKIIQEIKRASTSDVAKERHRDEDGKDVSRSRALGKWAQQNGVNLHETNVRLLSHYWQLIAENRNCIVDDFQRSPLRGTAPETQLFKGVELINENDIVIGAGVEVRSGTVLDASEGAIIIANGARIEPNAIIYGPCAIGEGSIVRGGAKVGQGTTLGKHCRIGGEVGECIFASYGNKQHEGFMGHSYIGSWVNIGAGSCTSDLKNNYGLVRAWTAGRMRDTGRRFLGATIGDHSKIAINSRLNTGSVVGFNANVVSVGFPPKFVPSFAWELEPELVRCELGAAIETAKIMMDRRNVNFTAAHGELFKTIERLCRLGGNAI
jgi:UDP-N-acetylglucosamine diphosphorylase/glucosamine-1-phosphate N-acetyltransferase